MNKIDFYQHFVDQLADKLALGVIPKVKWSRYTGCKMKEEGHAHAIEGVPNFGLICITQRGTKIRGWEWLLAHEVAHFAIRDHYSQEFAKVMVTLGYATTTEQKYANGLLKREDLTDHDCLEHLNFRSWRCKICGFSVLHPSIRRTI